MRMKKGLMGCFLVIGLLLGQVFSVSANPSKSGGIDVTPGSKDDGYVIKDDGRDYPDIPDDKKPVTPVFELTSDGSAQKVPSLVDPSKDVYRVTFDVSFLPDSFKIPELGLYYYLEDEDRWVYLEPVEYDTENKTVTFEFDFLDMPMFMVLDGEVTSTGVSAEGTSPKTGVTSTWMYWGGAAFLLAAVAVILSERKKMGQAK